MNNIAFVYHYWNINSLMSYYGYKESWNKKLSPHQVFVNHPLGEKSTNVHYCSSCRQKRWKEACENGEIYGEIIAIFTGENAGELAHEYEHQMIITHKEKYGQNTLYNRNDGYAKFSTAGKKTSEETKKKLIEIDNKRWAKPGERKKKSDQSKEMWKNPDIRKQIIDGITGKTRSEEQRKNYSKGAKDRWGDKNERKRASELGKRNWENQEYRNKFCKIVIQYTKDGNFVAEWPSVREIIRQLGLNVSNVCNGKAKTAGGFIWKYKE